MDDGRNSYLDMEYYLDAKGVLWLYDWVRMTWRDGEGSYDFDTPVRPLRRMIFAP